jgi:hypothetical protein
LVGGKKIVDELLVLRLGERSIQKIVAGAFSVPVREARSPLPERV